MRACAIGQGWGDGRRATGTDVFEICSNHTGRAQSPICSSFTHFKELIAVSCFASAVGARLLNTGSSAVLGGYGGIGQALPVRRVRAWLDLTSIQRAPLPHAVDL